MDLPLRIKATTSAAVTSVTPAVLSAPADNGNPNFGAADRWVRVFATVHVLVNGMPVSDHTAEIVKVAPDTAVTVALAPGEADGTVYFTDIDVYC